MQPLTLAAARDRFEPAHITRLDTHTTRSYFLSHPAQDPRSQDSAKVLVLKCPAPARNCSMVLGWNHSSDPTHSFPWGFSGTFGGWLAWEGRREGSKGMQLSCGKSGNLSVCPGSRLHLPSRIFLQGSPICFYFPGKKNSQISKLQTTRCW